MTDFGSHPWPTSDWLTDWWLTLDLTHDWPVTDWLMTDFGSHPWLTSDWLIDDWLWISPMTDQWLIDDWHWGLTHWLPSNQLRDWPTDQWLIDDQLGVSPTDWPVTLMTNLGPHPLADSLVINWWPTWGSHPLTDQWPIDDQLGGSHSLTVLTDQLMTRPLKWTDLKNWNKNSAILSHSSPCVIKLPNGII